VPTYQEADPSKEAGAEGPMGPPTAN
jgi:hypothetical protein